MKVFTHYGMVCLYFINIYYSIFVSFKFCNLIFDIFDSKAIKIGWIIILNIQTYPISSYWFICIKIFHLCCIFYFRQIISWTNTINFCFIWNNVLVLQNFLKDEMALKILTRFYHCFAYSNCTSCRHVSYRR